MRRANSLVGLLAAVAIIAVLAVVLLHGQNVFGSTQGAPMRKDGKGKTILGASLARAKDAVCIEDIRQVRESLQINRDEVDNKWPATLQDLRLPPEFYKCPIGGEPYQYDPNTGVVKCVHPGHEKY